MGNDNDALKRAVTEIERLRAELARAEEAAGDYQALERTNAELNADLAAARRCEQAADEAQLKTEAENTKLRADLAARDALLREAREVMDNAAWLSDAENVMELEAVKKLRAAVARIDAALEKGAGGDG